MKAMNPKKAIDIQFLSLHEKDPKPLLLGGIADPNEYIAVVYPLPDNKYILDIIVHGPSGRTDASLVLNDLTTIKSKLEIQYPEIMGQLEDVIIRGDFNCPLVVFEPNQRNQAKKNRNDIAQFLKSFSLRNSAFVHATFPESLIDKSRSKLPLENSQIGNPKKSHGTPQEVQGIFCLSSSFLSDDYENDIVINSIKSFQWGIINNKQVTNLDHVPVSFEHKGIVYNVCNVIDPADERTGIGGTPLHNLTHEELGLYNEKILDDLKKITKDIFGAEFTPENTHELSKEITTAELRNIDQNLSSALASIAASEALDLSILEKFPISFIYQMLKSNTYRELSDKTLAQRRKNGENLSLTEQDLTQLIKKNTYAQVKGLNYKEDDDVHNLQVLRLLLWNVFKTKKIEANTADSKSHNITLNDMLNDLLTILQFQPAGGFALSEELKKQLYSNKREVLNTIANEQMKYCKEIWAKQNTGNLPTSTFIIEAKNRKEAYTALQTYERPNHREHH